MKIICSNNLSYFSKHFKILLTCSETLKCIKDEYPKIETYKLPNINKNTLRKIETWAVISSTKINRKFRSTLNEEQHQRLSQRYFNHWVKKERDVGKIFELTAGANYLKYELLLNLCKNRLFNIMNKKTPTELAKLFKHFDKTIIGEELKRSYPKPFNVPDVFYNEIYNHSPSLQEKYILPSTKKNEIAFDNTPSYILMNIFLQIAKENKQSPIFWPWIAFSAVCLRFNDMTHGRIMHHLIKDQQSFIILEEDLLPKKINVKKKYIKHILEQIFQIFGKYIKNLKFSTATFNYLDQVSLIDYAIAKYCQKLKNLLIVDDFNAHPDAINKDSLKHFKPSKTKIELQYRFHHFSELQIIPNKIRALTIHHCNLWKNLFINATLNDNLEILNFIFHNDENDWEGLNFICEKFPNLKELRLQTDSKSKFIDYRIKDEKKSFFLSIRNNIEKLPHLRCLAIEDVDAFNAIFLKASQQCERNFMIQQLYLRFTHSTFSPFKVHFECLENCLRECEICIGMNSHETETNYSRPFTFKERLIELAACSKLTKLKFNFDFNEKINKDIIRDKRCCWCCRINVFEWEIKIMPNANTSSLSSSSYMLLDGEIQQLDDDDILYGVDFFSKNIFRNLKITVPRLTEKIIKNISLAIDDNDCF